MGWLENLRPVNVQGGQRRYAPFKCLTHPPSSLMHNSLLPAARTLCLVLFIWLTTTWLAAASRPAMPTAQAAQELATIGRLIATVNGQARTLVLADLEVALPLREAGAVGLPAGSTTLANGAQHRVLQLPFGVRATDWLQKTAASPSTSKGRSAGETSAMNLAAAQVMAPVFYEEGRAGQPAARYIATTQLLLIGCDRAAAEAAATATGSRAVTPSATSALWVLSYESPYQMLWAARELQKEGQQVEPQLTRPRTKRAAPSDPLYPQQFYFKNTGQEGGTPGEDLNIESLWPAANGAGVTIAVVDDGLELDHPDLAPNIASDPSLHRNVLNENNNPTPPADANHGTVCAGFIAARSNNGIGLTGAAPQARLVGVRLLGAGSNGDSATDVQEAAAFGWRTDVVHISSNSWGPNDDGQTVSGPDTSALAALREGVTAGRGGRGVLYFVATGNGRESSDHAGYDGYSGSRYVMAIGATDNRGQQAPFSESGPQVIVCAAGQTREDAEVQLLATDNIGARGANKAASPEGDYTTSGTQGTSYATPQVAGVGALILQANPNLSWRDVKEILIRTARKNDPNDSDWIRNGAGFNFSHKYGAGFVDAAAAVALASRWTGLGVEQSVTQTATASSVIPDNSSNDTSRALVFASASNLRVETVEVSVSVTHANRGQLRFELVSPAGTRTVLGAPRAPDAGANLTNWVFSTPRHWGESGNGTWTVQAFDTVAGVEGSLTRASVTLYGATAAAVAPTITTQPDTGLVLPVGMALTMSVVATGTAPLSYQWRKDGVPISGAIGSGYTVSAARIEDAGTYTVVVSNSAGSVTSTGAVLTVNEARVSRISNVSIRTTLNPRQLLIVGLTMTGGTKDVLMRAVGPGLGAFGVSNAMVDPDLSLFEGDSRIATNDNWGGGASLATAAASVGAFPLVPSSKDAALLRSFSGGRTLHVQGADGGNVIVEAYDAGSGNSPRLSNVSARNFAGSGGETLIAGFSITGNTAKRVLIRAVGPTLGLFGVAGAIADPKLEVYAGSNRIAENDNWSASLASAFSSVGAFGLTAGSRDSALEISLNPGGYTVHVTPASGSGGEVLIEIYELP